MKYLVSWIFPSGLSKWDPMWSG